MPIFEFRCRKCEGTFELLCFSREGCDAECPSCGGKDLEKLLSSFCSHPTGSGKSADAGSSCAPKGGFS
jgi:putative FmdB family regulatory protein